ncbi:MAG: hypothetical protein GX814_03605 [Microbacteriaceae bacterium]|nr:hypothetical protein [Microbacteriaceae bacterium]
MTLTKAVFSAPGVTDREATLIWQPVDADRAQRAASQNAWQRLRARYSLASYGVALVKPRERRAESAGAAHHEHEGATP